MKNLLQNIRIADFSHVMAGPFASHILRQMGAEVIKIEPRRGDSFRNYGSDRRYDGMSPAFIAANAGKKSIALDLKDEADADIARRIVARCDVVLENFRPGVMDRLGFGYDAVRAMREDVIYCSVSGYGQDGPLRDWPAIDNIVQATSGMMMLSGEPGDPPMRVGFPIVDTLTGQTAAIAILGALVSRLQTGQGANIDVSMLDASLSFMTSTITPYLVTGQAMPRTGNTGYSGLPTASLFTCRDGRQISLGVVQDNQFAALATILHREEWLDDGRFATAQARRENFALLTAELDAVFAERHGAEWETLLCSQGVPCGLVRHVDEAVDLARPGTLLTLPPETLPGESNLRIPALGFQIAGQEATETASPPHLDEDRDAILAWLADDPSAG